jgi:hypothetical protein
MILLHPVMLFVTGDLCGHLVAVDKVPPASSTPAILRLIRNGPTPRRGGDGRFIAVVAGLRSARDDRFGGVVASDLVESTLGAAALEVSRSDPATVRLRIVAAERGAAAARIRCRGRA